LETTDGCGDIELYFDWGPSAFPAFWMENDFEFISDVREVEALLLLVRSVTAATSPARASQWPPGIFGEDAPKALAFLCVMVLYLCATLYPFLIWVDLKELARVGRSAFDPPPAYSETLFSPFSSFALVPFLMFFLHSRARKFKSEMRLIRYFDAAIVAGFAILGPLVLFAEHRMRLDAGTRTGAYVMLGVFALLLARGRDPISRV
jgi:hypothetical protein